MSDEITIGWRHGLGDTALFAPALKLWIDRGHAVRVHTTPDKAPLFEAAGATVGEAGGGPVREHHYGHPPGPGAPQMHDHWSGNKVAWNLSQGPLPFIGQYTELWSEYLAARPTLKKHLDRKAKREIDDFLGTIEGPLVLLHTRGNTSPDQKNLPPHLEADLYRELLARTDATLLLLDWDDRVERVASRRVRHLSDDFRRVNVPELWYLVTRAACLVGVDSGPLHLATKWTDTPTIGVWHGHHPAHFAAPSERGAHLVASSPHDRNRATWNRHRRHSFNILDVGERHTGAGIAEQVRRVLEGKVGPALVLEQLLDLVHVAGAGDQHLDRDQTFRRALDHLRTKADPRVVETGCIRSEDDWTAGWFTYICGLFLADHGGHLDSVDISPQNVAFARRWTEPFRDRVTVHESDSVGWLQQYAGPPIDVAYLDSLDADQPGHAEHGLKEAELVLPHLAADGLVLIDDTHWRRGAWVGKGRLAIPFLQGQGFRVMYSGYQTLLGKGAA